MSDLKFDKQISNNESGVLAKLWRKILIENNLENALPLLINMYIKNNDETDGRSLTVKKKNKSTLTSNITATDMTFKTFLDLVFRLLKVTKIDISVKLTFSNGRETTHSVSAIPANNQQLDKETDLGEEHDNIGASQKDN